MNSEGVRLTVLPSTSTVCREKSIRIPPTCLVASAVPRPVELAAAKQGPDAADELGGGERLGDVVVGADLEPDDPVDLGVERGQQDDRQVAFGAEDPADVRSPRPGHHHVADQQVVGPGSGGIERGVAVLDAGHLESLPVELVADRLEQVRFVVGQEDAVAHTSAPWRTTVAVVPWPGLDSMVSFPPMRLGRSARDREAEAEAVSLVAVDGEEAVEDAALCLGRDARSRCRTLR